MATIVWFVFDAKLGFRRGWCRRHPKTRIIIFYSFISINCIDIFILIRRTRCNGPIFCFIHLALYILRRVRCFCFIFYFYRSSLYIIRRARCNGVIFCFYRSVLYITALVYDAPTLKPFFVIKTWFWQVGKILFLLLRHGQLLLLM